MSVYMKGPGASWLEDICGCSAWTSLSIPGSRTVSRHYYIQMNQYEATSGRDVGASTVHSRSLGLRTAGVLLSKTLASKTYFKMTCHPCGRWLKRGRVRRYCYLHTTHNWIFTTSMRSYTSVAEDVLYHRKLCNSSMLGCVRYNHTHTKHPIAEWGWHTGWLRRICILCKSCNWLHRASRDFR